MVAPTVVKALLGSDPIGQGHAQVAPGRLLGVGVAVAGAGDRCPTASSSTPAPSTISPHSEWPSGV
jgi:hypothetical protein